MAGYRTWLPGEEVTAANLQGFIQSQVVPRFTSTTQRSSQYLTPDVGALSRVGNGPIEEWNGSAWVALVPLTRARVGADVEVVNLSVGNGAFVTISTFTTLDQAGGVTASAGGITIPAGNAGVYVVALRLASSAAPTGALFVACDAFIGGFSYVRATCTAGQVLATSTAVVPNNGATFVAQVSQNTGAAITVGARMTIYQVSK